MHASQKREDEALPTSVNDAKEERMSTVPVGMESRMPDQAGLRNTCVKLVTHRRSETLQLQKSPPTAIRLEERKSNPGFCFQFRGRGVTAALRIGHVLQRYLRTSTGHAPSAASQANVQVPLSLGRTLHAPAASSQAQREAVWKRINRSDRFVRVRSSDAAKENTVIVVSALQREYG